ncbi:endolytic transglycosylase MltG, partial [Spinactinospora alkalitolerans]
PPRGRRRRGAEPPPSPDRGSAPEDDAPPRGRRRRGTESQAGDPLDRSEPATGELPARGRRRASAEAGPEPRGRRSRRSRAAGPEEEPAELLDLPFEDDDDEDEPPRRRSQRRRESRSRGRRGDGRRSSRRRRRGRLAPLTAVLVIVLFVGAAGAGGYTLLRTYLIPPDFEGEGTGDVEVVVEEGDTGTEVGTTLEEAGVVASVRAFTNALRGEDADSLAPGTYRLRSEMSADAAVSLLLDPSSRIAAQVTIREGLRSTEILEETAKGTGIPLEELEAAYQDSESLDLPDYATEGAEGYLFPATYTFDPGADATEVLAQMVDRYKQVVEELELERRAEEADLTPNEVMSIAAIVQAETGGVEDMPEISSVVYNRLEADMELKMDSTCFYAIGEYGIAMNSDQQDRCEASDSEYKTYFRKGLPVGPIVSPGADAIDAALDPAETDWLFFVATDPENGVTEFAETEAEFWELVEKFNQSQQE